MTYQGTSARVQDSESGRAFEVLKVRIGADGHVSEVLWTPVQAATGQRGDPPERAPVAEVVDAIHDGARVAAVFPPSKSYPGHPLPERTFVVVEHADGRACITFPDGASPGRNLTDMERLDA